MAWLIQNYQKRTLTSCAKHLGFCPDTLRRVLVREGVAHFPGAKYTVSRKRQTKTWKRPCIKCGDTHSRPRNQYICTSCHRLLDTEGYDG